MLVSVSIRATLIEDVLRMREIRGTHHGSSKMVSRLHRFQNLTDYGGSDGRAVRNAGILGWIHEMKHSIHQRTVCGNTPWPTLLIERHPQDSHRPVSIRIRFVICDSNRMICFLRPNSAVDRTLQEYRAAMGNGMFIEIIHAIQELKDM